MMSVIEEETEMDNCSQCGEPTDILHDGYCQECWEQNQRALDLHNAQYDHWQSLTDEERDDAIRRACRMALG